MAIMLLNGSTTVQAQILALTAAVFGYVHPGENESGS